MGERHNNNGYYGYTEVLDDDFDTYQEPLQYELLDDGETYSDRYHGEPLNFSDDD